MCGRYRIKENDILSQQMRELFNIPDWADNNNIPRFNIGPGQDIGTVLIGKEGAPKTVKMRWGLVPTWDNSPASKLVINARSEGAFEKRMFRDAVQNRRCVVPADGFYEWKRLDEGKTKLPYDIYLKGERPFFIAGIFEYPTGAKPATCLVFTTQPNELMAPIHDRMPVILDADRAKAWIATGEIERDRYCSFINPHPADDMEAIPISTLVNSVKNDGPEVLRPATHQAVLPPPIRKSDLQGELF
jgi:putative SOS response-associated peptidase YedK